MNQSNYYIIHYRLCRNVTHIIRLKSYLNDQYQVTFAINPETEEVSEVDSDLNKEKIFLNQDLFIKNPDLKYKLTK